MQPTRNDMAEFFRLALNAQLSDVTSAVRWAESIVAADATPHIAFIELCISAAQPVSTILSLLADVPGDRTADLPVKMLLGHAFRLLESKAFPEQLLLPLYQLSRIEMFPDEVEYELDRLDDAYYLALDRTYGTMADVAQKFSKFLANYERYAPDIPLKPK